MENYRSKSYADGRYQIQSYNGASNGGGGGGAPTSYAITSMQDLRCYSASYATSVYQTQAQIGTSDVKFKKGKSTNGSTSKRWSFNDPELQRKRRVASYKVYAVEGKVKGSLKKSFRWIKERRSMPLGVLRMINNNCCGEGAVAAIPWELLTHLGRGWW
ncbi:uncharacterized protein LOC133688465 [Populus nigra]|uniref:uncharacterized protein LOC133688465 n=1 Tax=Populus nigra TaxID=3691 RepID=UPI002B27AE2F|nr:uncharacterized protein LOC133688465 [Populus nigra]